MSEWGWGERCIGVSHPSCGVGLWPAACFITKTNRGVRTWFSPLRSFVSFPSLFSPVLLVSARLPAVFRVQLLIFVGGEMKPGGFFLTRLASSQRRRWNACLHIALWEEGEHLPLLSVCISRITPLLTQPPPISPQLQSIHFPIFSSYPYLSILSASSFRRRFFPSSPVDHADDVSRFSVARGERRRAERASVRRWLMVTSRLVFQARGAPVHLGYLIEGSPHSWDGTHWPRVVMLEQHLEEEM